MSRTGAWHELCHESERIAELHSEIRRSWRETPQPTGALAVSREETIMGKALEAALAGFPRFAEWGGKDWRALETEVLTMTIGTTVHLPIHSKVSYTCKNLAPKSDGTDADWDHRLYFHSTSLHAALCILQGKCFRASPLSVGDAECLRKARVAEWPERAPGVVYTSPYNKLEVNAHDYYLTDHWLGPSPCGPTGNYKATLCLQLPTTTARLGLYISGKVNKQAIIWAHHINAHTFHSIVIHRDAITSMGRRIQQNYLVHSTARRDRRRQAKRLGWLLGRGDCRPNREAESGAAARGYTNRQERRSMWKRKRRRFRKLAKAAGKQAAAYDSEVEESVEPKRREVSECRRFAYDSDVEDITDSE